MKVLDKATALQYTCDIGCFVCEKGVGGVDRDARLGKREQKD